MPQKDTTTIEFRKVESGDPDSVLVLTGGTSEIHKNPEKLRELMKLLDLPEGTLATVTVKVSTTIVR